MRTILLALVVLLLVSTVASANGLGVFGSWWKPKDLDDAYGGGCGERMGSEPFERNRAAQIGSICGWESVRLFLVGQGITRDAAYPSMKIPGI